MNESNDNRGVFDSIISNEVWAKVMFLNQCVILFTRGGVSVWGFLSRGVSVRETPQLGKKQAVRILLEWILVLSFCHNFPMFA